MELEYIIKVILTVVVIVVGIGIISSMVSGVQGTLIGQIRDTIQRTVNFVFSGAVYNICSDYNNKNIRLDEFQSLLQAMEKNKCSKAQVYLTFSLTQSDLEKMMEVTGINRQVIVAEGKSKAYGIGALIVFGSPGPRPLKVYDTVEAKREGGPKPDIILTVVQQGCDPYDDDCDASCSLTPEMCDPLCYRHEQSEGIICDIDCVDVNGNKTIDAGDYDDICDLDCYNNHTDPDNAYDPDCVKVHNTADNICDPDSNGVRDDICDRDCANPDPKGPGYRICDFDCDGNVSEGNPDALKDEDCYICDGECNNFCSPACTADSNDTDCSGGSGTKSECCGNGFCAVELGEDCATCSKDCPPAGSCTSLSTDATLICCPGGNVSDTYGCGAYESGLQEGAECSCPAQCAENLTCSKKHCCPKGKIWDGTACVLGLDVLIVAIKANMKEAYSDDQIKELDGKVSEFIKALGNDELGGMFLYLDEDPDGVIPGGPLAATDGHSADKIQAKIIPLLQKMKTKYLIIIGGFKRFPQNELPTGSCSDPMYSQFQTDQPYVDMNKDQFPDIPVGRLPDPNGGDLSPVLTALDTYTALHNSGGLDFSDYASISIDRAFGGCRHASSGVCFNKNAMGVTCFGDQCKDPNTAPSFISGHNLFMLLMHGGNTAPQTFSHDPCEGNFNMNSNYVPSLDVKNAVWLIMPCYGGLIKNKETTASSMPMQFLKGGGAVYFGGSLTNHGNVYDGTNCPAEGDHVIGSFYQSVAKHFEVGNRIGDAHVAGIKDYSSIQGACNFRERTQNNLYGDPTLKIKKLWR